MRSAVFFWGPPVAMAAVLFWLSHQPRLVIEVGSWDFLAHAGVYALLGLLVLRATHRGWPRWRPAAATIAWLLTTGYGALDELHQSFVPGRVMSLTDLIADACGAAGAVAWLRLRVGGSKPAGPAEER